MGIYNSLELLREEIEKCMRCGNCQAVCPIYKSNHLETAVARGKIQLAYALLQGLQISKPRIAAHLSLCLTCKACVINCPSGVSVDKIILAARAELVRQRGLPWLKNIIFQGVKSPSFFELGMKVGSHVQNLFIKKDQEAELYHLRFPIGIDQRRVVPPLAKVPIKSLFPEINTIPGFKKRVLFFTGCMINYVYTDIGYSVVKVLHKNGLEVLIPREQHCCGLPVLTHGDVPTAKEMARSHVELFSKIAFDALLVACPTCGCSFKQHYPELLSHEPEYHEKAQALAKRTYDIAEFLVDHLSFVLPSETFNTYVTYHDPCHLVRSQNVRRQPRQLLQSIPGIMVAEMAEPDRCCGGAGSFALAHSDMSVKIGGQKARNIIKTEAKIVATGCPSCLMQLTDSLYQEGMLDYRVMHIVQLLEMAYC